jgi:gas vesicle protein
MSWWMWLVIGMMIGACVGLLAASMCGAAAVGRQSDDG